MKNLKFTLVALFAVCSLVLVSCKDDSPSPVKKRNVWVGETMDTYYLWEDKIEDVEYHTGENTFDLFERLVYRRGEIDRWSFITDDYQGLLNLFAGVYKSTGYSFRPYYRDQDYSNEVICIIEYVESGSPADVAQIKRGDIFYKVDGQVITDDNFYDLVNRESLELTFGILSQDRTIEELLPKKNIRAVELQSNPILKTSIVEANGIKIAYLAYTSFIREYDKELEAVFADFKNQGVDELVLDLRYNSGGSVSSAVLLCSLIAPASKVGSVLFKENYNELLNRHIISQDGEESLIMRFQANANNLDLSRVVVLTTRNTASASEMIIYGLKPHMDVIQIGEQTHGKYYASATFTDDEICNWAIQPIIFRTENSDNSIDYTQGLWPDKPVQDLGLVFNQQEVFDLGEQEEEFFALAIQAITGNLPSTVKSAITPKQSVKALDTGTKLGHPLKYDMHYDLKK